MEIKPIDAHRLEIVLSQEELFSAGVLYEQLDCRKPPTRALLLSLLEAARLRADFTPDTQVLVEAFPDGTGGCVFCFSDRSPRAPKRWRVQRRVPSPVVYAFDDVDTLIDGSVKLFRRCSHRIRKSTLYRLGKSWRLVIYPLDVLENITLSFLDEFAPRCGEGATAAAWLDEHAERIVAENAVDLLSAYFG